MLSLLCVEVCYETQKMSMDVLASLGFAFLTALAWYQ